MASVYPSSRSLDDSTRRATGVHAAKVVPLKQRPEPLAARVDEGTRREHVRMELLVARARAARER
jgi:hypothetical protein